MPSCECCWANACARAEVMGGSATDHYRAILAEHNERNCACSLKTPEGDKARAGQFWVDGQDTRKDSKSP